MEEEQAFPMPWRNLRFPEMRMELITLLHQLSDVDFQQRMWMSYSTNPQLAFETLKDTVAEILDTRGYGCDEFIDAAIGGELFDSIEAESIKNVCHLILQMIGDIGKPVRKSYLNDDRWPAVVAAAKSAYELMKDR